MQQNLIFDKTITAENDPLVIHGLTSPVVVVSLIPETLKGSYPEAPALAVEQILPNGGSPFIADRQLVEMKSEPMLVRLRANYPYSLRIDYPGWISRGILKVWEVTDFDFFSSGGSSAPLPDLTGYVQTTDPRLADARAPLAHTQGINTIDGLQSALDAKANIGTLGLVDSLGGIVPACTGFAGGDAANLSAATDGDSNSQTTEAITGFAWNAGYFLFDLGSLQNGILAIDANVRTDRGNRIVIAIGIYWSHDDVTYQSRWYDIARSFFDGPYYHSEMIFGRYIRIYGQDKGQGQCRIALRDVKFYRLI